MSLPSESQLAVLRQIAEESVGIEMRRKYRKDGYTWECEAWAIIRYVGVTPNMHCQHVILVLNHDGIWEDERSGWKQEGVRKRLAFQRRILHNTIEAAQAARAAWLALLGGAR